MATSTTPGSHIAGRPPRLRKDLRYSVIDGTMYCVMVGVGESYLVLFALKAGHGAVDAGLVATVPYLAGALLQMLSPAGVRWMRSLRRWIVLAAAVQAAMFIPLALMAVTGWTPLWLIYLCAALYWGSGLATGPAWSTWIGILVPRRLRARYFGRRSRLCNLGVFAGLATGGLALEYGQGEAPGVAWFAALFAAGFVFRAGCAMFLSLQSETGPVHWRAASCASATGAS
jgi:MFS family permease